jgi:uncharacterized protein (DUF427 family)
MSVWMRAHEGALHEPTAKRVRIEHGGETVAETDRPLLVWEPRRIVPSYAVPIEDLHMELTPATEPADAPDPARFPVLHPGIPFSLHTAPGQPMTVRTAQGSLESAAFQPSDPDLDGYVILDFRAFDAWYEEDERIVSHPQDPFKRISTRASSRQVRIEVDGQMLAESKQPRLLFETGLPTRYYLPWADVRTELLTSSDKHTYCAYKGEASYWSVNLEGRVLKNLVWTYKQPLHEALPVRDLLAFYNERVDIVVDGARQERPVTIFSQTG